MGSSFVGLISAEGFGKFPTNIAAIAGKVSVLALDMTEESSPVLGRISTVGTIIGRSRICLYSHDFGVNFSG